MTTDSSYDAIIIGGGLAGLAAATYLGRAGHRTLVLERSARLGGRAVTQEKQGFHLNVGPHALYAKGEGCSVLADLDVSFTGGQPTGPGRWILDGDSAVPMPGSALGILTSGLLTIRERFDVLRVLARLSAYIREPSWQHRSIREWLATELRHPRSRDFVGMYIRLATYCASTEQNAPAALRQLAIALQGVWYLDHGWQTFVEGLAARARQHGVTIETSAAAPLVAWAASARPIQAACLDIGLSSLPNPRGTFVLGLRDPYYLSVHTPAARLAPAGGAVIHVARYLGENDPPEVESHLEALLDRFQPGWHDRVVTKRFLPRISVTEAGLDARGERPGPAVPGLPRLFVAGDWVGAEGMLVDASLASARHAAELANHSLAGSSLSVA